jgi:serine/threonine protein kinase
MPYFPPYILQHLKTTPHPQQDLFLSSRHLLGFRPKLMFQIQQKYGNAAVLIPPTTRSTSQNLSKFHLDAPSVATTNNNMSTNNAAANNSASNASPAPSPEEVQAEANRRVGKIREQLQIALEDALTCAPKTPDVVAEPIVVSVALQVLSVLQCLHHTRPNPMAHCDIKLENILVADSIEAEFGNVGAPPSLVRGSFKLHHESGSTPANAKGAGGAGNLTMQANEKIAADNQVGNRNDFMPIMPMINATMGGGSTLQLPGANGEHFNTIEEAREYHKKRIMEVDTRRQKEIRDRERELHRLLNTQLALPSAEMVFGGGRQVNFKVDLAELVQDDLTTDLVPGGIPVPSIMEIIQKSNRDLAIAKQKRRASRQHPHDDGYSEDEDGHAKKRRANEVEDDVEPSPAFVTTISAVITPTIHVPPTSLFLPIVVTDLGLAIEIPRPPPNVLYQYVIAHEHFENELSNATRNNTTSAVPQQLHHTPVPFNYVDDPVDYDNGLLLPAFTLPYVAPECITSGLRNVSTKIDIWALGCVLYLIAAGKHDGMEYIDDHLDESTDDDDDAWRGGDKDDDTTQDGGDTITTGTRVNSAENLDGYDNDSHSSSSSSGPQKRRNNKKYQSGNTNEDSDDVDDIQAGFNTEDRMLLFNDNHLLGDGPSIMDGNYGGNKKDRNKIDVIMFEKAQHPRFQQRLIRELCDKRGYSIAFASFVTSMLQVNPKDRPTADELLKRIHRVGVYEYRII